MSLLYLEGFDDGFYDDRLNSGAWTVGSTYKRHGTNGGYLGNGQIARIAIPEEPTEIYAGYAFKPTGTLASVDGYVFQFPVIPGSNTSHGLIQPNADGFQVVTQSGTTNYYGLFTVDEWCYIEARWKVAQSPNGIVTVKVNGETVIDQTGIDTQYSTYTTLPELKVEGGAHHLAHMDDFYICDTSGGVNDSWLGDLRVDALFPDEDGTHSDLVGQDADSVDNYLNVDEVTSDEDTTYNESATPGNLDTYSYDDHPEATGTIIGAIATSRARKTDTADISCRVVCRSGGTDYPDSDEALGTGYSQIKTVYDVDPDTATAWTISGINAAEWGMEVRS